MAQYTLLQLTQVGQTALANAQQNGAGLQFSKIKVGDGTATNISTLTDLVNTIMTLSLESTSIQNGIIKISSLLLNTGLSTGFYLREIGIFVIQNGQELLYAYIKATTADFIPPESSGPVTQQLDFQLTVQSGTNVTFQVANNAVALQSDLNTLKSVDLKNIQDDSKNFRAAAAHSGVLDYVGAVATGGAASSPGSVAVGSTLINTVKLGANSRALLAGTALNMGNTEQSVSMPAPPTFGYREDLVFWEQWRDATDQSWKSRIRTVAGVDFVKYTNDGFNEGNSAAGTQINQSVLAQGGNAAPVSWVNGYDGFRKFSNTSATVGWNMGSDAGLYVAGNGDTASKAKYATYDGYVYAIPLFKVKRRNSGGYRVDNVNGAVEFTSVRFTNVVNGTTTNKGQTAQYTLSASDYAYVTVGMIYANSNGTGTYKLQIISKDGNNTVTALNIGADGNGGLFGDSGRVSDRPDGRYSNIVDKEDIVDLRHKVSLTGVNLETVLEDAVDKLQRAELNTKDTKVTAKERFALHRAPYGVTPQLGSVKVKGDDAVERDLVNLLGTDGDCETSAATVGSGVTPTLDTANKVQGNSGIKITLNAATGYQYFQLYGKLQAGKYYLVAAMIKNGNFTSGARLRCVAVSDQDKFYPSTGYITDTSKFNFAYIKLAPTDFDGSTDIRLGLYGAGSSGQYGYADAFRVYEIDQATYDKIDVDAVFTGDALGTKFPYVSSYPNILENLVPTDKIGWVQGSIGGGVDVSSTINLRSDYFPVTPSDVLSLSATSAYETYLGIYDSVNTLIANTGWGSGERTYTVAATGVKAKLLLRFPAQTTITTDEIPKAQPIVTSSKSRVIGLSVPQGRWNLPYDIANGDTKLRLDTYQQNRRIVSDRQVTDTITEVVDNLMTPQKHITVTQATAGVWAANDTIKVSSEDGVVSGVIDSDTALAKVTQDYTSAASTIAVDDVSKFSVNDTVRYYSPITGAFGSSDYTITAIDATNKTITVNSSLTPKIGDWFTESTASTSSPAVTAAGIAGTWSGLGTKTATYTISTPPTTTSDKIKIAYSVSYPSGKGIQNIPEMYEARVNGQRHVKSADGTVTIKANLEGKTSGSTDRNPHKAYFSQNSTALLAPSSFTSEVSTANTLSFSKLDGTTYNIPSALANGNYGQFLIGFDVIRAITDRFGNEVFADSPTLADKVAKAKTIITKIVCNWHGYGSSPTGNKATIAPWRTDNSSWGTSINNTASIVTKTSFTNVETNSVNKISNAIDANGMFYVIAYADASDGVTASIINTDYIDIEITLNPAETGYDVFVPENPFPVRVEQAYNEGENMLPPFNEWTLHANAVVNGKYDMVLNATATAQTSYVDVPVIPNQVYTAFCTLPTAGSILKLESYDIGGTKIATIKDNATTPYTFTTPSNAAKIRVTLYATSAGTFTFSNPVLTPSARVYPFVPMTRIRKSKRTFDFLGKVAGSVWENPHRAEVKYSSTFGNPPIVTEMPQARYNGFTKLDGTLEGTTDSTAGRYSQYLYEFDLSHLGLSLTELKRLLRKLTVSWTGYGQGDNAGAVGYGATMKMWNDQALTWSTTFSGANTGSTPSAVSASATINADAIKVTNKDQKVYVLVHTTYPASAANASTLYIDYIKLEVELSEEVDFVKGNIVKVMKETKEVKLEYPAYSYSNGVRDTVDVFYSYLPYQGQGITTAHTVLTKPDKAILTTLGTGKERPSGLLQSIFFQAITQMPIGSAVNDYDFINANITLSGQYKSNTAANGVNFEDMLVTSVQLDEMLHASSTSYKGIKIGDSITFTGTAKRGSSANSGRNYRRIRPLVTVSGNYLAIMPYLALLDGELYMVIMTIKPSTSQQVFVDGQSNMAVDLFKIPGRPLLKGVI